MSDFCIYAGINPCSLHNSTSLSSFSTHVPTFFAETKHQFMSLIFFVIVGDEEPSGPSWAAEDDDDPENRYGSKSPDVEFVQHTKCGRKAATSNPKLCAKSSETLHVIKTRLQSIQTRPKRSCSRTPAIKYTYWSYTVKPILWYTEPV